MTGRTIAIFVAGAALAAALTGCGAPTQNLGVSAADSVLRHDMYTVSADAAKHDYIGATAALSTLETDTAGLDAPTRARILADIARLRSAIEAARLGTPQATVTSSTPKPVRTPTPTIKPVPMPTPRPVAPPHHGKGHGHGGDNGNGGD